MKTYSSYENVISSANEWLEQNPIGTLFEVKSPYPIALFDHELFFQYSCNTRDFEYPILFVECEFTDITKCFEVWWPRKLTTILYLSFLYKNKLYKMGVTLRFDKEQKTFFDCLPYELMYQALYPEHVMTAITLCDLQTNLIKVNK